MAQKASELKETQTCKVDKFVIFEFNKPGRKSNIVWGFAPTDWIQYNRKTCRIQVKYIKPPHDKETEQLIFEKIRNEENPPKDWELFNVTVRSGASKFLKKISKQMSYF